MEQSKESNYLNYSVELSNLISFLNDFCLMNDGFLNLDDLKMYGGYFEMFFEFTQEIKTLESTYYWVRLKEEFRYGYNRWDKIEDKLIKLHLTEKRKAKIKRLLNCNNSLIKHSTHSV